MDFYKMYSPLSRPTTAASTGRFWRPTSAQSVVGAEIKSMPKSRKYEYVQAKVESGPNVKKIEEQHGCMAARFKRSEPFKRIHPSKLAQLLAQPNGREDHLILDLREKSDFNSNHIKDAVHYPSCMMSRSMYQFTPEISRFKNVPGKHIILYDFDEKLSISVGTNWFEKGIDNFAILSGGINAFWTQHPELVQTDGISAFTICESSMLSKASTTSNTSASPCKPVRAGRSSLAASSLNNGSTVLRRDSPVRFEQSSGAFPPHLGRNQSMESHMSVASRPSSAQSRPSFGGSKGLAGSAVAERRPLQPVNQGNGNARFWLAQDKMYHN